MELYFRTVYTHGGLKYLHSEPRKNVRYKMTSQRTNQFLDFFYSERDSDRVG